MNEWKIAYLSGEDTVVVSDGKTFVGAEYDWDDNPVVHIKGAAPDIIYFQKWMRLVPAEEGKIPERQRKLGEYAIAEILKDPLYVKALSNIKERNLRKSESEEEGDTDNGNNISDVKG